MGFILNLKAPAMRGLFTSTIKARIRSRVGQHQISRQWLFYALFASIGP